MVGSSIYSLLKKKKNCRIITVNRNKLNLLDQKKVYNFLKKNKPDQVYLCAAVVGGIYANQKYPAKFIFENLTISSNLIHGCFLAGVKKLMYLGSSCIYPKNSKIPIKEEYLLGGYLEQTNEAYALSKITSLKMCQFYNDQYRKYNIDFRAVMPCNLYGPNDNFDPNFGHVIPSLIYKFHEAKIKKKKSITLWGDGRPKREFLHSEDLAYASIFLMNLSRKKYYQSSKNKLHFYNIGSGYDITIKQLASIISEVIGYKGNIIFKSSKLNGTMRKLINSTRIRRLGWKPRIKLKDGIKESYKSYLNRNVKYFKYK